MFHQKNNHSIKRFISLIISLLFFLQTTLSAGEHILLQSVTGKVDNLQLESANVILQSLNNVSHHETTRTTNGALTTTTTMKGSNIETIAGTNLVVGGNFIINGDDLTAELYDGVLTSQATREDPAKAQAAIKDALNAHIQDYLKGANNSEDETNTYSGYSSTAISTIQTTAVYETWDESTTSLNAVGQLVVQAIVAVSTGGISTAITGAMGAAGSSVLVQAAVSSVVNQLSTEILTAVITGESLNIDLGSLVTNAVKSAVFAGVTNAIDTEMFGGVKDAVNDEGVFNPDKLNYTQKAVRNISHASVSTLVYGGDFKQNVINAVGESVAAPAFNYIGHTLTGTDGLKLDKNALSTKALITTSHALVGGAVAELSGGEFSSGAVATAVGHVVSEAFSDSYLIDRALGRKSAEEIRTELSAIGKAVGGATVILTQENVSDEELARATALAESVIINNTAEGIERKIETLTPEDIKIIQQLEVLAKQDGIEPAGIEFLIGPAVPAAIGSIATKLGVGVMELAGKFGSSVVNAVSKYVNKGSSKTPTSEIKSVGDIIPGRVQTRINVSNDGFKHITGQHFEREIANNRSVFTIEPDKLKSILQNKNIVSSHVTKTPDGQYYRVVDTGQTIGTTSLKEGGIPTSKMRIFTDKFGNIKTAYPVR